MVFPEKTHFVVTTGGLPLATTKCVITTAVATGGAAMGSAVATGGLPWVVSTGEVRKYCAVSEFLMLYPNNIAQVKRRLIFD